MADIPESLEDQQSIRFHVDGTDYETRATRKWRERKPWIPADRTTISTLIPGLILEVLVKPGQRVRRGEGVVVIGAMKMANDVESPWDGVVKAVLVSVGQSVMRGAVVVELEA